MGMIPRCCLVLGALMVAAPVLVVQADSTLPSLSGPEVYKVGRNTRALLTADLDNNGLPDLAFINNEKAKIDILYQYRSDEPRRAQKTAVTQNRWQPELDDARFWQEGIVTGTQMLALAVGDLNQDGQADFAFTSKSDGLVVLYQERQDAAASWERRWTYQQEQVNQWRDSLLIDDLDNDGRADLLMMAEQALLVFYQDANGKLGSPRRYPLADSDSYGLTLADANQDGLDDMLYLVPDSRYALRLRLQRATGG